MVWVKIVEIGLSEITGVLGDSFTPYRSKTMCFKQEHGFGYLLTQFYIFIKYINISISEMAPIGQFNFATLYFKLTKVVIFTCGKQ